MEARLPVLWAEYYIAKLLLAGVKPSKPLSMMQGRPWHGELPHGRVLNPDTASRTPLRTSCPKGP